MELNQFKVDNAKKIMDLWKKHLGFWHNDHWYFKHPEVLVYSLKNPESWVTGRFEDRIGSRYTDDSKLLAYLGEEGLEFECYAQAHTVMRKDRQQEADRSEEAFNKAVMEYAQTVKS